MHVHALEGDAWVRRVALFCACCALAIGLADLLLVHFGLSPSVIIARSFNVALEESVCTWFSSVQALFVGLVAGAVFLHSRAHEPKFIAVGWALVALFFVYVSIDDTAKLHERLGTLLRIKTERATDVALDTWFPSWGWQLFLAPLFVAFGLFMCLFFWRVVAPELRGWFLAGFGLLGTAVGLDFVEGLELPALSSEAALHLQQLLEEVLEMLGTTTFLYVFLSTLNSRVQLQIVDRVP